MDQQFQLALSYDDVLLVPRYSKIKSRNEVNLTTKITRRISLSLPLISSNMSDVTDAAMAVSLGKLGGLGVLPRFISVDAQAQMVSRVKKAGVITAAAVGLRNGFLKRGKALVEAGAEMLFLDVAHGHMLQAVEATRDLKSMFGKNVDIVSGNVATYDGADALFKAGADSVKVGIGPGSICTTRIETGSGVPQITAIIDSARAARKHKKTIICDGGIKNSGDIVKGLAAGASAAMMGNQFAGTDKSPGKLIIIRGKRFKQYNASTSLFEKKSHVRKNGTELDKSYLKQIEGVESIIPYKGPLKDVVETMTANIKSGLSYSGAKDIETLWKNAKFVRITAQGLKESNAHDIIIVDKK